MARAYKELEAAGVVATRGRNGTVVCARDEAWSALVRRRRRIRGSGQSPGRHFAEAVQLLAAAYDAGRYAAAWHTREWIFEEVFD